MKCKERQNELYMIIIQFEPAYNVGGLQLSLMDAPASVKVVIFGVNPDDQAHHGSSVVTLRTKPLLRSFFRKMLYWAVALSP